MTSVLVLCDDRWHPAAVPRAGLAPLAGSDYRFDWVEDVGSWSTNALDAYDVVILTKANNTSSSDETAWMTEAVAQGFVEYVEKGGGLLVIHSGTAGYVEAKTLRALMGGVFLQHPPQCMVTVAPRSEHELAGDGSSFTQKDEHYFVALDDKCADVFLSASSEHGMEPAGWTRHQGAGRICVLTPGHNLAVWLDPCYQAVISRSLAWCNGSL